MMKEAERAKKEMLAFLKKNESTGTAKEDFCELKEKTEQVFFVSLALDLRERRAKLWKQGRHDEVDSWALSKIHEALVSDRKTEVRKITDIVEKNTHAALRKRFPDLYDFLYACNDDKISYEQRVEELHKLGYTAEMLWNMPHYDTGEDYLQMLLDTEKRG